MKTNVQHFWFTERSISADRYLIARNGSVIFNSSIGEEHRPANKNGELFVIADGMSGLKNDRLAAEVASQLMMALYQRGLKPFAADSLKERIHTAHYELRNRLNEKGLPIMGCSLLILWIQNHTAIWLSLGNGLIYRTQGNQLQRINVEHTLQEFARRNWFEANDSRKLAQAWIFGSKIPQNAQHIYLELNLDYGTFPVQPGERYLLASDELNVHLQPSHIQQLMSAHDISAPLKSLSLKDDLTVLRIEIGS
ncbi:MAG: protein phosphatase 2C domain-containing protein [Myxococcota bacterium]|nr:protein phosphatase 2C domain-containing protein [Myxococcota bacterium]